MGLQYLYENPEMLAKQDPEIFDLVINCIRGDSMIKIKWIGKEAIINDSGAWSLIINNFRRALIFGLKCSSLEGYYPDQGLAMLEEAKKQFPGLEVLDDSRPKPAKISKRAVY